MKQPRTLFVTGTDTGVGKTVVAAGLLRALARAGRRALGIKPVAAGCAWQGGRLVNDDALALQRESVGAPAYEDVNPVALEPAIAPHVAAGQAGLALRAGALERHCDRLRRRDDLDFVVVEGAGGWLVPLNDDETLADLCQGLAADVVLVVGMRLGCLNHALLSAADVERRGMRLAGWVASCLPPQMVELDANFETLRRRLGAPCWGRIPAVEPEDAVETASRCLDLAPLLEGAA